jgi:hypothetical protein
MVPTVGDRARQELDAVAAWAGRRRGPPVPREKALALDGAEAFDPGMGRPMKERVLVPLAQSASWPAYAAEALDNVRG